MRISDWSSDVCSSDLFGDHLGERAPGVVLKMPLRRDDVRHEPLELVPIVDQLGEQMAQNPVEQDAADVEEHDMASHAAPMHAKATQEASDGRSEEGRVGKEGGS